MSHYYRQHLLDELTEKVQPKKVVVIYGPRRVGKTTLLEKFLETQSKDY
ncbi:MAG: AAA family ATPase, partial [Gammaproteobacteria bacterium]|nr:AAA family ATPase [Gammaproteobacteria bacterium]